jgi:gliding motility-associated-like protein
VINSDSDIDDFTALVTVHPSGNLNFTVSSPNNCVSSAFAFTNLSNIGSGSFTSHTWNFNDGPNVVGTNANHTFSSFGTYQVTLSTVTNNNCTNSFTKTLEIFPEADVDFEAQNVCLGEELQFTNTTQVGSGLVSYSWNFGDASTSSEINPGHKYATDGDFAVNLVATTEKGCITNTSKQVTTHPVPVASFVVSDHCFGTSALFSNQSFISSGGLTSSWDFADGNTSTQEDPAHLYTVIGNYEVTLIVKSAQGCEDTFKKHLYVSPKPIVNFSFSDICFGADAEFFNNTTIAEGEVTYLWDFGDGKTSQSISPVHAYDTYGSYDVTLEASTPLGGCTETMTKTIDVNQQPVAAFEAEDDCLDSPIIFDNTSAYTGTDIAYSWEFGDGKSSADAETTHLYTSSQTYQVTLRANATNGCSDSFVKSVQVFPLPLINFIADNICDTQPVEFRNFSSIASGTVDYTWDFGDQTSAGESDPIHLYVSPATYPVKLTAVSNAGCTSSKEKSVTIYPLPVTGFDAPAVCDSHSMTFTNLSSIASGEIIEYGWDFGDQTNSIVRNPNKEYLTYGTYLVKLTSFSDHGCKTSLEKSITVHPAPVANFSVGDVCSSETIQINNTSQITSGGLSFRWNFGDGNISIATSPSHDYADFGVYTIQLIATSEMGCKDSISRPVVIFSAPMINAGEDQSVSQGYPAQLNAAGGVEYRWEPIDGLNNSSIPNPVATPLATTTYIVFAKDSYGCGNSDTVKVSVSEEFKLVASNVLTPDNNGKNDTWVVQNVDTFGDVFVRVYDRWGKLVFEQEAYQNDWKGLSGKDILPDGTYYYYITFSSSDKVYKGALSIIRNKQ